MTGMVWYNIIYSIIYLFIYFNLIFFSVDVRKGCGETIIPGFCDHLVDDEQLCFLPRAIWSKYMLILNVFLNFSEEDLEL